MAYTSANRNFLIAFQGDGPDDIRVAAQELPEVDEQGKVQTNIVDTMYWEGQLDFVSMLADWVVPEITPHPMPGLYVANVYGWAESTEGREGTEYDEGFEIHEIKLYDPTLHADMFFAHTYPEVKNDDFYNEMDESDGSQ